MTNFTALFGKIRPSLRRILRWSLALLLVLLLAGAGVKGWRLYQKGMAVYRSVNALRAALQNPAALTALPALTASVTELQDSLQAFTQEAQPLLWLAPKLGWIPRYGGDLENAPRLLELANRLTNASLLTLEAGSPLLNAVNPSASSLTPADLTTQLVNAQPYLKDARAEFDLALEARRQIAAEALSPRLNEMITSLDPLLAWMDDGLTAAETLPAILGADGNGAKTYLLLVQNEDELRPTGGFITTIGRLVMKDGKITSLEFEGVDDNFEDWTKPYPAAPWQMQEYMNAPVLILRDSNWFPDFPTSARWAEYLYSFVRPDSLDGVIAFDQQFLVILLSALGPLNVEGAPYPLTSANVIEYMRSAKAPPPNEPAPADWYRKHFIEDIAGALLRELMSGANTDWRGLAAALTRALNERHLLMYFHDPAAMSLLAERNWDNTLRPPPGDFLMTTDTNIGFNKTNALVDVRLSYEVDLADLSAPTSVLTLTHRNRADSAVPCMHWDYKPGEGVDWYPMQRCYWSYLRVYKQAGGELLEASPHEIPAEWILTERTVPPRVDVLDEPMDGIQGYGVLLVVPGGQSLETGFEFSLPASVVSQDASGNFTYRLKVQKQAGTLAHPLTIRVHLPRGSTLTKTNLPANLQGSTLLVETNLRTDVYLEVTFHVP
ncbi:MAG: DUF4012 domain-containing protein [Chloroflexota bacterium]|nr:DUF4012 domain-containing protein [Chloroflexota bacterium]MBI5703891.1 DUF4012 domain-containing protein [Chloroflexota bacterium]